MRAVRDGTSRAGKSCPAPHTGILSIARARCKPKQLCCYINPDFSVKLSEVSEHSESDYLKIKKNKKKKYSPVQPSHSVNKYILLDGLSYYNTRGYFASCVVFFRAPQGRGKMQAMSVQCITVSVYSVQCTVYYRLIFCEFSYPNMVK